MTASIAARFSATKQGRFTTGGEGCDEIGDRLALAGTGRPDDDQIASLQRGIDDSGLRAVSVQDEELVFWRRIVGNCAHIIAEAAYRNVSQVVAGDGIARECGDELVLVDSRMCVLEITHHWQFGVGERREHDAVHYLKLSDLRRRAPEQGQRPIPLLAVNCLL